MFYSLIISRNTFILRSEESGPRDGGKIKKKKEKSVDEDFMHESKYVRHMANTKHATLGVGFCG